ncbi:MAG TPA: ribonuclease HII [Candidatus Eisenbacteria bacterium]|nr:ribonuclease HII [Candidatus Eisenbacteria bacterium]
MKRWRHLARAETKLVGTGLVVAGVDEVGRGPLAGPVVAAAVVLEGGDWDGLDDSKVLTAETRATLYTRLRAECRATGWAVIGARNVDAMNIKRASLEAMRRALMRLGIPPDVVLVDGTDVVPGLAWPQHAVVDGDARMLSIAAASVVAKVVRDRIMERLDAVWPHYGFARHKGYSTPEHLAALRAHGPCPIHRFSYAPVRVQELPLEFGDEAPDVVAAAAGDAIVTAADATAAREAAGAGATMDGAGVAIAGPAGDAMD